MKDNQNYLKIRSALMDSTQNGKIKYSYFVRSSLKELEALTKIFHLSEIGQVLKIDTGIDLTYNSFWQAYNRFKTSTPKTMLNAIIESPEPLKESSPASEIVSASSITTSNNYEWLEVISIPEKLKEIIVENHMTESEFLEANINLRYPVMAAKQIIEYISARNATESSNRILGNNYL